MTAEIHQFRPKGKPPSGVSTSFFAVVEMHMKSRGEKPFHRLSEPHIVYTFDEGDTPTFWALNDHTDEFTRHAFNAEQILATDWSF